MSHRTVDARLIWNQLNGIISVFKPAGVKCTAVKYSVIGNLVRDLNSLKVREPRQFLSIDCIQPPASGHRQLHLPTPDERQLPAVTAGSSAPAFRVQVNTDLSDHVLAVGPRYQVEDVRCNLVSVLGERSSGVLLLGLNGGTKDAIRLAMSRLVRCYHVHGRFGTSTEDNFPNSRIMARSSYTHIWPDKLAGLLASIQASHQKKMFELCGVDPQSQAAYELAAGGLVRPADGRVPLVYGLRCVEFKRPDFTVEVHALNESESYLGELVQEIGRQLHSVAHCTGVRCVRHGHFGAERALLRREWTVQGVVDSLQRNRALLERYPDMLRQREARITEVEGVGAVQEGASMEEGGFR